MNWLEKILGVNPNKKCDAHQIMNCPTCFKLVSDKIIEKVEIETKNLKKVKTNEQKDKDQR